MARDRWKESVEEDTRDPQRESLRAAADLLARILDTAIPIPGTNLRIGLDPLLGLLPGIGDALANLIGSTILMLAARLSVPKIVLMRMGVNILLNGAIGAIPVAGDAFSVWFQSNARNAVLLRRANTSTHRSARMSDWIFVVGILLATLALIIAATLAVLWLITRLWQMVQ